VSRSCDWSSPIAAGGTEEVDGLGDRLGWQNWGESLRIWGKVYRLEKCVRADEGGMTNCRLTHQSTTEGVTDIVHRTVQGVELGISLATFLEFPLRVEDG
jgi:hypothetical protein